MTRGSSDSRARQPRVAPSALTPGGARRRLRGKRPGRPPGGTPLRAAPSRRPRNARRHHGAGRRATRTTSCSRSAPPTGCSRAACYDAPPVHAFEIDRRFTGALERLAADRPELTVHVADALKADLTALRPEPTAFVANLAYNIAIPIVMRSIEELPGLRRWAVMVQKELADRLFARPSTKAYSAVSVLVQLACPLEKVRPVPPVAFRPQPRVDSSFVTFRRRESGDEEVSLTWGEYAAIEALVRRAFGHRRKVLTNTLAGIARGHVELTRGDVRAALGALGLAPAARPEELSPPQWVAFARQLDWLPT